MNYLNQLPSENEHCEYKKAQNSFPKDAWESISAFENTDGGKLILGITETKNTHQFSVSGVTDVQKICDDFWSGINNQMVSNNNFINDDVQIITVNS